MLFAAHPRDMNHSLISTENNEDCSSGVRSQIKRRSEEKPDYFIYLQSPMDIDKRRNKRFVTGVGDGIGRHTICDWR